MFYDKNNYGDIPLQEATHNNGIVAMESFLELGVSFHKSNGGWTTVPLAANRIKTMELLLHCGPNLDLRNED